MFVIAPAIGSRRESARWTADEHAYQDAAAHLDATLRALGELEVDATGRVGSHDPLQAADDGLREFRRTRSCSPSIRRTTPTGWSEAWSMQLGLDIHFP